MMLILAPLACATVVVTPAPATRVDPAPLVDTVAPVVVMARRPGVVTIPTGGDGMPNRPQALPTILDWNATSPIPIAHETFLSTTLTDSTAPKSPGGVRRYTIPAGAPGEQVGSGFTIVPVKNLTEVYVARWLRPSANLIGDGAGSKSMMISFTVGGSIYFNYETTPDALINPIVLQPRTAEYDMRNDTWLHQNRGSTPLRRGQWGLWEYYVKLNDPGVKNGIIRAWANGVLQLEIMDWRFIPAGQSFHINNVNSNFYQNAAQRFPMWWDVDHFYISGR